MICENCGSKHSGAFGSGRFCCKKCACSFSSKTVNNDELKEAVCATCGCMHYIKKRASQAVTTCVICTPKKIQVFRPALAVKHCCYCGNEYYKNNKLFCSNVCRHKYTQEKRNIAIKTSNGVGLDIRVLKNYKILNEGHRCVICGNTFWQGKPIPLVLDHINGRASDNNLDNLRLVCGNCDMQLPTYKSKNKNSDRTKRKGKYF